MEVFLISIPILIAIVMVTITVLDPKDPTRATLAPSPSGVGIKVTGLPSDGGSPAELDLGDDSVRDMVALIPRLREHGKLGIAKVILISPTATTAKELVLDIDNIGAPPRRVQIRQSIDGTPPKVDERVYILVDSDNPNIVALVPPSMTNGQRIPAMANRLKTPTSTQTKGVNIVCFLRVSSLPWSP
jgi:hypothetical protein